MKPDALEQYRLLAMSGVQGRKSEAIRELCDEINRLQKRTGKRTGFVPPTIDEINAYAREIGVNTLAECEGFRDHYQANGWKVGRVRMIDWKAGLRNWKRSPFRNGHSSVEGKLSIGQRHGVG